MPVRLIHLGLRGAREIVLPSRAMGIVLLGYRGSGKTTVARVLGEQLDWPAIDTDQLVIASAGKTIREIFAERGEPGFRDLEIVAVREAIEVDPAIISLGGGAILRDENRQVLNESAHLRVFLHCDAAVLHARIHADPLTAANRPSLTHLGGTLGEIEQLLARREPLYRAVMTDELDVTNLLPEAAAAAIVKLLK